MINCFSDIMGQGVKCLVRGLPGEIKQTLRVSIEKKSYCHIDNLVLIKKGQVFCTSRLLLFE